ncbi:hypothetical protein M0813_23699 [Anaeramoeba flamelloides]|uniref:Uncharacterized protein n=1 Tax=Anaeramoeba flamelloides TaxID=1746091 RepID=A0ABQ8YAQ4_9EUKA|nr:hypothetical protein M0813_23699 [Anaeramoeba flamelloides]
MLIFKCHQWELHDKNNTIHTNKFKAFFELSDLQSLSSRGYEVSPVQSERGVQFLAKYGDKVLYDDRVERRIPSTEEVLKLIEGASKDD